MLQEHAGLLVERNAAGTSGGWPAQLATELQAPWGLPVVELCNEATREDDTSMCREKHDTRGRRIMTVLLPETGCGAGM